MIERLQTENIQVESSHISLQAEEILSDVKARLGNIVYIVESNQQKKICMSGKNNTKKSGNNILNYNLDVSGNVYFIASEDNKDKTDYFLEKLDNQNDAPKLMPLNDFYEKYSDSSNVPQIEINSNGEIYFDFVLWDENTLLMRNDSSLFQYNIKEKYLTKVFNWSEYGIVGDYINAIYIEDEDIHCIIGEEDQLRDIAWKKSGIRQEKAKLILGCNEKNEISAVSRLNQDVLTGKGPDIIEFDYENITDSYLGDRGLLEDLTPYIESSEIIAKEEFIPSIYSAIQTESKLYILPTNFELLSIITKNKWIDDNETWSIDEILNHIKQNYEMPKSLLEQNEFLYYCLSFGLFSPKVIRQEEFLRACLEYAKYLPEKVIYEPDDVVRRDGEVFFDICGIYTVKDYMYKKSIWGSDASHTGFPSAKDNGMAIVPLNTYGISAKSDQKEKAWEFIECFFTKEGQEKITPNYDFSICSDILNQQFEQTMEIYTYTDEEQVIHEHPILSYYLEGAYIDVYAPRQEDI